MIKNSKEIIITTILLIIFTGLLCFNYISYEAFEKRTLSRIERHKVLEAQQQERLAARQLTFEFIRMRELARDQDIRDMISFNQNYLALLEDYRESIAGVSRELEDKVVNIEDIEVLVDKRITAARSFKDGFTAIENIPGPLEEFYDLFLEFLESDISTWQETRSYYSGSYEGSSSDIQKMQDENSILYRKAEDLLKEVYSAYDLEDLP